MITITVCIGSSCHLKGSYNVVKEIQGLIEKGNLTDRVLVKASFCLGNCTRAVSVKLDEGPIYSVNMENVNDFFRDNVLEKLNK